MIQKDDLVKIVGMGVQMRDKHIGHIGRVAEANQINLAHGKLGHLVRYSSGFTALTGEYLYYISGIGWYPEKDLEVVFTT